MPNRVTYFYYTQYGKYHSTALVAVSQPPIEEGRKEYSVVISG